VTWYWDISDGTTLEVWDHTQDPATDAPLETRTNEEGWSWSGDIPQAVFDVMATVSEGAIQARTQYAIRTTSDAAFERIERVGGTDTTDP